MKTIATIALALATATTVSANEDTFCYGSMDHFSDAVVGLAFMSQYRETSHQGVKHYMQQAINDSFKSVDCNTLGSIMNCMGKEKADY